MSDQSNKELLMLIGNSSFQLVKNLWHRLHPSRVTFTHWLLNLAFILLNAAIMVGMAYLILKAAPELLSHFASLETASTETQTNDSSFWDILGAFGSILAGTGSVVLAYVAIKAAKGWQRDILYSKSLDQLFSVHTQLTELLNEYQDLFQNFILDWSKSSDDKSISSGNVDVEELRYELMSSGAKMTFVTEKIRQRLEMLKRIFEFDDKKHGVEYVDSLFKNIGLLNGEVMRVSRHSPLKVFNVETNKQMQIDDNNIQKDIADIHALVLSYTQLKHP